MTTGAIYDNGDIISFYLRVNENVNLETTPITSIIYQPEVVQMVNNDRTSPTYCGTENIDYTVKDEVKYTKTVTYSYVLGNINGDVDSNLNGIVDLTDAQRILSMISAYQAAHPGEE